MNHGEYEGYDALGLSALVRDGQISAPELLETAIAQIERHNPSINAVIRKRYEAARLEAKQVDKAAPFAGVPFLVKDLVATLAGEPTGSGNGLNQNLGCPRDSEIVRRYRAAGLVMVGRTNVPEFGITPYTEPKVLGATRNPWSLERSAGGSSGGSAAAVAARMTPMASASDGGGSIRIPSSCCGVFGFKPSRGMTPLGPDLSEIWRGLGIEHAVTRSVRDSAAMLDATCGIDPGAPYAAPSTVRPFLDAVTTPPAPLRIAFSAQPLLGGHHVHADCLAAMHAAAGLLEGLGHRVEEASPDVEREAYAEAFLTVLASEVRVEIENAARSAKQRLRPTDFETLTYALGLAGRSMTATSYIKALQTLQSATRRLAPFFENYDVLLTPTLATPPAVIGSLQPPGYEQAFLWIINRLNAGVVLRALLATMAAKTFDYIPFTPLFNITGQPAMSVPLHWNDAGLPIGVQFAARFGGDGLLFQLAGQLQAGAPMGGAGAGFLRNAASNRRVLMIEAVIWDFGGVITSSPFEAFARFEREHGLPADIIRRTNARNHWHNAWARFERAEVDAETFDRLFAAESLALGAEVRGKDVLPLLSGELRPEMVEALRRVGRQFKTGCITNNVPANSVGSAGGRSLYVAEVMALFDHVIESAKIGLRKPDPLIYRMMTEALGVDPGRCIYLDDLGVNLKPARDMGMITIKVANASQAIAELEAATSLSLR